MEKLTGLELESMYDDMLNEVYGEIEIAGYKYGAAFALYRVDQIVYEQGMRDYADSLIRDGYEIEGF